jgi:hypothetical protein
LTNLSQTAYCCACSDYDTINSPLRMMMLCAMALLCAAGAEGC